MIVVDAGVLTVALVGDGPAGVAARRRLDGEELSAPALIDLEVASALRGLVLGHKLAADVAERTLRRLEVVPVDRAPHAMLLRRCWALRDNLTTYDAAYVALAELLGLTLVTADARLATAPGARCKVEVLAV